VIFKAILDASPTPALRLNPNLPPKLEEILVKALEKDRNLRYQHAAEMRADLQRLNRDIDSSKWEPASKAKASFRIKTLKRLCVAFAILVAILIALFTWRAVYRRTTLFDTGASKAIAVLPFQNTGTDKGSDFLQLALADEIATNLSSVPSFSIRPVVT